ncbi:MAG: DNA-binding protein [Thermosphaera sp.]
MVGEVEEARLINVGGKPVEDYVFEAILVFQEGSNQVVLKGSGVFISKAVDVYNALTSRLGDSVELVKVEIGSDRFKGRFKSYIAITVRKKY